MAYDNKYNKIGAGVSFSLMFVSALVWPALIMVFALMGVFFGYKWNLQKKQERKK